MFVEVQVIANWKSYKSRRSRQNFQNLDLFQASSKMTTTMISPIHPMTMTHQNLTRAMIKNKLSMTLIIDQHFKNYL
ncbi:MAG: hypothetical protein ACK56I_35025, partial [bacterium]